MNKIFSDLPAIDFYAAIILISIIVFNAIIQQKLRLLIILQRSKTISLVKKFNNRKKFIIIIFFVMNCNFAQDIQISNKGYASFSPEISSNSSGNIIIVWTDYRNSNENNGIDSGSAIYGQFLDSDGDLIGGNFRVSEASLGGGNRIPSVSMNSEGNFVVAWHKSNDIWKDTDIYGRRFRNDGSPIGSSFQINDDNSHKSQLDAKVIMREDESFIVTWLDRRDDSLFSYAQIYSSSGDRIGNNFRVNKNNEEGIANIGLFTNGSFFLSWNRYLQIYDNSSIAASDIIDIGVEGTCFAKGRDTILVIWNLVPNYKIWGRFFDIGSNTTGDVFRIDNNDPIDNPKSSCDVSFSKNGSFIVVWDDHRNDLPGVVGDGDIYGQRFDAQNDPIGYNFKINHEKEELSQRNPVVNFLDTNFITVWLENKDNGGCGSLVALSDNRFILAALTNFDDPIPGQVFGWQTKEDTCDNTTSETLLFQNYPNPFNLTTSIRFQLPKTTFVKLTIYDLLGQEKNILINNKVNAGMHEKIWNATGYSSGVYIAKFITENYTKSIKVILAK